jgi:hypothetical protein
MLKRTVRVLAIAHAMAANAGLTSPLLSIDDHGGGVLGGFEVVEWRFVCWERKLKLRAGNRAKKALG